MNKSQNNHASCAICGRSFPRRQLESERGELTALEREVVHSLREHELLSANVDARFERAWSLGERLADRIASFGVSWPFMICFGVFLVLWIATNSLVLLWRPVDPYPFILLNLVLSCLAAIQAVPPRAVANGTAA